MRKSLATKQDLLPRTRVRDHCQGPIWGQLVKMPFRRPGTSVFFSLGDMLQVDAEAGSPQLDIAWCRRRHCSKREENASQSASNEQAGVRSRLNLFFRGDQRRSDVSEGP